MKPIILKTGQGLHAGNPIATDLDIALVLQQLCGAEGYTIKDGQVLALRWVDGVAQVIERFDIEKVDL